MEKKVNRLPIVSPWTIEEVSQQFRDSLSPLRYLLEEEARFLYAPLLELTRNRFRTSREINEAMYALSFSFACFYEQAKKDADITGAFDFTEFTPSTAENLKYEMKHNADILLAHFEKVCLVNRNYASVVIGLSRQHAKLHGSNVFVHYKTLHAAQVYGLESKMVLDNLKEEKRVVPFYQHLTR